MEAGAGCLHDHRDECSHMRDILRIPGEDRMAPMRVTRTGPFWFWGEKKKRKKKRRKEKKNDILQLGTFLPSM